MSLLLPLISLDVALSPSAATVTFVASPAGLVRERTDSPHPILVKERVRVRSQSLGRSRFTRRTCQQGQSPTVPFLPPSSRNVSLDISHLRRIPHTSGIFPPHPSPRPPAPEST